jgi:hypothetical protein
MDCDGSPFDALGGTVYNNGSDEEGFPWYT